MPVVRGALQAEGAVIDVLVGWSEARARQLRLALRPVPSPVTARAVIDTGAEITCVGSGLIQMLGLPTGGTVLANVPAHGGITLSTLHDASLTIVHPSGNPRENLVLGNLSVLDVPLSLLGFEVLFGRDILANCHFFYSGPRNIFHLAY